MLSEPVYAIDTEFHRERTYFPKLALVQIAYADVAVLVDPFEVDLSCLTEVFEGPGIGVFHAADQDLEVLDAAVGTIPSVLFDTQIAASFLGMSSPSLAALYQSELGVSLKKGDRLTDWLRRPLREQQQDYALSDVLHLIELHQRLSGRLAERERTEWVAAECELLRLRDRSPTNPEEAWRKIREARHLKGAKLGVVAEVAAWRERRAAETDQPVRFILPDLAVVSVAQRSPKTTDELRATRGVEDRHIRGGVADTLVELVETGQGRKVTRSVKKDYRDMNKEFRPAVALVAAWVGQLAREVDIDAPLLATRADIEGFLRDDPECRLSFGWRAGMVGMPIRQLVDGKASLAFDRQRGLVVEARSHQPPAEPQKT